VIQDQFLNVIDRDEAERRFRAVLDLRPLAAVEIVLSEAHGRVLAADIVAPVDVPGFDRSNVDGYAVRAEDTFGATEDRPCRLRLTGEVLATGVVPTRAILPGMASVIATGAVVPRGADAIVMVEYTDAHGDQVIIRRPVTPGANLTFAGTDLGRGETVLRRGDLLTARETGVLAALGVARLQVVAKPQVAILSTGNELVPPGQPLGVGSVYDSNATVLADAVRELGGHPVPLGIVPDDRVALADALAQALRCDVVLLSGGTSKGEGDLSYRVVGTLGPPGIVVHGVALKPGKPLCLAAVRVADRVVPVVILPGFPTSAIFTFHEFVAPVVRALAGRRQEPAEVIAAQLPVRVNSERGRTEYLLVGLVQATDESGWIAYPMGKGSGSVTAFSRADGFVVIGRQTEYVEAGAAVEVHLLGHGLRPADLVVIGSHCVGLDYLLGQLQQRGLRTKFLAVGSTAGLEAARRGECDLAGVHLLDPQSGQYNQPFLTPGLQLLPGYQRLQGIVFRPGDARFEGLRPDEAVRQALADPQCMLVNRNRGSGTRILIEGLLQGAKPPGYATEARSHNAVVAAVQQGRADWGVAIAPVARAVQLSLLPLQEEHYDFVIPTARWDRPAVQMFREILALPATIGTLEILGFHIAKPSSTP
jgi:putative molybdopterin biosynthesis protein